MWNITSTDVEKAKERLDLRRAEIESRYADEKKSLDAELAVIETFERAASEFALRHAPHEAEAAAEPEMVEAAHEALSDGDAGGDRDILKPGSRWRLYRAGRPPEGEGTVGENAPGAG